MCSSPPIDQNLQPLSSPTFYTRCVESEISPVMESPPRGQNSVISLSPEDFKNLKRSLDTLFAFEKLEKLDQKPADDSVKKSCRRTLLPLPTHPKTESLDVEKPSESFIEPVERSVQDILESDADAHSNWEPELKKQRHQFSEKDVHSHTQPYESCFSEETSSSPFICHSSFSSSSNPVMPSKRSSWQAESRSSPVPSSSSYPSSPLIASSPNLLVKRPRQTPPQLLHSPRNHQPQYLLPPPTTASSSQVHYEDHVVRSRHNGNQEEEPCDKHSSHGKRKGFSPYSEEHRPAKIFRPNIHQLDVWEQISSEIWKLYNEKKQTTAVFDQKMELRDRLLNMLKPAFPTCSLYVVGSSMTGLGTNSSDMDMCLMLTDEEIDQSVEAFPYLHTAFQVLRQYDCICDMELIPAKVPILKFRDSISHIEVDLNVNNSVGIRNTQLLNSYSRIDERVRPLILLAKLWARYHGINDAKFNTLSSYSLVLMIIHFLQFGCSPSVVPCLQDLQPDKFLPNSDVRALQLYEELPDFSSRNRLPLARLFLGFLNYYASEFNFQSNVMSIRTGGILSKVEAMSVNSPKNKRGHWKFICIEEPFELTNTACSVFRKDAFDYIQNVFRKCSNILKTRKNLREILNLN